MKKTTSVIALVLAFAMLAGPAIADNIYIDLVENPGANDITLDLADGPLQQASVLLNYAETNSAWTGDGSGCNVTGSNSQVTFPVVVTNVSGTNPTLDKTTVRFENCGASQTINISATAVGVISVALGAPISPDFDPDAEPPVPNSYLNTNKTGVTPAGFNVDGAAFSVTVIDSTQVGTLDAPEIANAYLGARADNDDCKSRWGTARSKQANWHGQLINHIAKHPDFQGVTFTNATKSIVEGYVESACTTP